MIDCQWDRPQVTETTVECTINDTTTWIGGGEEENNRFTVDAIEEVMVKTSGSLLERRERKQ